ncbi:MAG: hypothetical protein Q8Q09_20410 [Deltaproteobacteria bacterium]|nr:hypothetical protein [Deltaproteobacteria bacterium]
MNPQPQGPTPDAPSGHPTHPQQPAMGAPYGAPPNGIQPVDPSAQQAAKLVRYSSLLGWGGLLLATAGACGVGALTRNSTLIAVVVALGFGGAILGAIVGQIGRAMQGRVI